MAIERFSFDSHAPGTNLLVFGAIHGDEHCGPVAIERIIQRIQNGKLQVTRGSVTFVPVCNPEAYSAKKRVLKENLNRVFRKTEHPESTEAELANELCPLVDACDALLDIHSSFVPAPSNVFVDYPTPENMNFAKSLSPDFIIFDWPLVYKNTPHAFDSWTTDRYAHEAGKIGILAECGKHDDPQALILAEQYILRTLSHFKLVDIDQDGRISEARPCSIYMTEIFKRESADDRFTKPWYHLEPVASGTTIAVRASGEKISVTQDSYIIFPKEYALPEGEWFYLGMEKPS